MTKIYSKRQALHEREAANSDKLQEHSKQLGSINNKLDYLALSVNSQDKRLKADRHDIKIKAIEGNERSFSFFVAMAPDYYYVQVLIG